VRPRPVSSLLGLAALVVVVACPSVARADPASDAKDLFARGRELRAHGDCASAVGLFRKAFEIYPAAIGSARNLAECEESLAHWASARRAWLDVKRGLNGNDDKKYDGWARDADEAAARLAPKLASVTIDLTVLAADGATAPAAGVDVTLDGEPIAGSLLGTALERDPGRHVVRAGGAHVRQPSQSTLDLAAGDAKHVALRVVLAPDAQAAGGGALPVTPPAGVDDAAERARTTKRTVGWAAIGVGGASLVGAGISLALRQSAIDKLGGGCNPGYTQCDPSLASTTSMGQTASVLVNVLGIAGVVGVTTGIVLLATSGHTPQSARLVVMPAPGGASALWTF